MYSFSMAQAITRRVLSARLLKQYRATVRNPNAPVHLYRAHKLALVVWKRAKKTRN